MRRSRAVSACALLVAILVTSCGLQSARRIAPASPSASRAAAPTKPTFPTAIIPAPTSVRWGIDSSGDPARPYLFELYFTGGAASFHIVDEAGQVVLRVPIAGSGIFGPDTCLARHTAKSSGWKGTWVSVDAVTYGQIVANSSRYRVEAEAINATGSVTLPLVDSGCRP
jgi:hypothetical protein